MNPNLNQMQERTSYGHFQRNIDTSFLHYDQGRQKPFQTAGSSSLAVDKSFMRG